MYSSAKPFCAIHTEFRHFANCAWGIMGCVLTQMARLTQSSYPLTQPSRAFRARSGLISIQHVTRGARAPLPVNASAMAPLCVMVPRCPGLLAFSFGGRSDAGLSHNLWLHKASDWRWIPNWKRNNVTRQPEIAKRKTVVFKWTWGRKKK